MKLTNLMLSAALALFGVAAFGQEQPAPAKGKERTMTGCLNKGADQPQHYKFTNQQNGREIIVTGGADLEKHAANHTVKITGTMTNKVFNVTKVEHVAGTCEAKK